MRTDKPPSTDPLCTYAIYYGAAVLVEEGSGGGSLFEKFTSRPKRIDDLEIPDFGVPTKVF